MSALDPTLRSGLAEAVEAERPRLFLWVPVLIGVGIATYFGLGREPPPWVGAVAVAAGLGALWIARARAVAFAASAALLATALGFAAAQLETHRAERPHLPLAKGAQMLVARVIEVDLLPEGRRLLLAPERLGPARVAASAPRVRLRVDRGGEGFAPGDRLAVRAVLLPPTAPTAPGAYDFARQAFFDGLGAVGFALGPPRALARDLGTSPATSLAALRHDMTRRIVEALPGASGAVAAALITGERGPIPEEVNVAFRDSGLAHLLSISGLHMTLVAGIAFLVIRGGLALVPFVALRYPIKKAAAAAAMVLVVAYTLLAGAPVPAQRACLMTCLVLLAVIVDRLHLSPRVVAWAAIAVLLAQPSSLLGASFQMSFAAVVALIAAYEAFGGRLAALRSGAGPGRMLLLYLAGIAFTSAVATLATTPFSVHHFNRLSLYSLPANMLAVPLTGFLVMPAAMLAVVAMPFGWAAAFAPLGWSVDLTIDVARWVAAWPHAVLLVPTASEGALMAVVMGGLWLAIWQRPWRWLGLAPVAAGVVAAFFARPPDVLVSGDGRLVALRSESGGYAFSAPTGSRIARETWLRRAGATEASVFPAPGTSSRDGRLACDQAACLFRIDGQSVAVVREPRALAEECRLADLVVTALPVRGRDCKDAPVIDREALRRSGPHAVWLGAGPPEIVSVAQWRGERPWTKEARLAGGRGAPRAAVSTASAGPRDDPGP